MSGLYICVFRLASSSTLQREFSLMYHTHPYCILSVETSMYGFVVSLWYSYKVCAPLETAAH